MTDDAFTRIEGLEAGARRAGEALARAFTDGADAGRRLDGVLRDVERNLAGVALRGGVQALGSLAASGLGSLAASLTGFQVPAAGAGLSGGLVLDRLAAGRAEPAARAAPAARPVTVSVQIATPDAASFRRSEAQVAASLARAVQRGARAM